MKYCCRDKERRADNVEILVVDDHALRGVLKEVKGNASVLETSSCSKAMQVIAEHPDLDLILLDPTELGANAIRLSRWLCCPLSGTPGSVVRALDLGALGFVPKSGQREVMVSALQLVFAGGIYIQPEILGRDPNRRLRNPTRSSPSIRQVSRPPILG
jgi:DNA-binding NarL/FixJ family response regulator